ncbi:tetratricopeptide repeat protein [Paenibacillus sp. 453mf]|nr:tetratricopeptide repeat protein [Paenibacillus sp. 453mf]SFS57670.1 Tetratrico peptide repeat-containing protein [Paenibacillus sp. 453mf]
MNLIGEAIKLRNEGNKEEALERLLQLLNTIEAEQAAQLNYQIAWTYDSLGLEKEAVPYYLDAISMGIQGEDRSGALLGLGSTYRTLGQYEAAENVLRQGIDEFPENKEFRVFLAMVQYNLKEYAVAMRLLLEEIAENSSNSGVQSYRKAIAFYADKLDQRWD